MLLLNRDESRNELALVIAVASRDEIRILWTYEDDARATLTYGRYFARDISTERIVRQGVRSARKELDT